MKCWNCGHFVMPAKSDHVAKGTWYSVERGVYHCRRCDVLWRRTRHDHMVRPGRLDVVIDPRYA